VNYGDFLRAMITADFELVSTDEVGQRGAMIEAFRARGIYPAGVTSLAEDSLRWPDCRWDSLAALPTTTGRWAQAFGPDGDGGDEDDGQDAGGARRGPAAAPAASSRER